MKKILFSFCFVLVFCQAIELSYWPSSNPDEIKLASILVEEWNKKNLGIHVKMQPLPASRSSEEILLAAIVAKTTPDICSNISPGIIRKLVQSSGIVPLDTFSQSEEFLLERMSQKILDGFRSQNGKLYQIPWKCNPPMIAYNVSWFKRLGIEPAKTYSEFWKISQKLTADTNQDGKFDTWAMGPSSKVIWFQRLFDFYSFYIAASQGKTLLQNNQVLLKQEQNKKAAIEVFRFFQEGFQKKYFPNFQYDQNFFLRERIAMEVVGPWKIAEYEKYKSKDFVYDFTPIPHPDHVSGPSYTYADAKNIVIFSTCKHPVEAWKFVQFLISKHADRLLMKICYQLPIRKNLNVSSEFSDILKQHPLLQRFADQASYISPLDDSPNMIEILDCISQQYEACSVYGILSPEKAVENSIKRMETILSYW